MKNKLELCENAKIFSFPYLKKHIIKNLRCLKGMIISAYQRLQYGVSRSDARDFDHYLMVVIENGLKYLKDEGNSYPGWCTYEDWQKKLEYMIKLGEIANKYEDEITDLSFDKSPFVSFCKYVYIVAQPFPDFHVAAKKDRHRYMFTTSTGRKQPISRHNQGETAGGLGSGEDDSKKPLCRFCRFDKT